MGASSDSKRYQDICKLANDQYVCTNCKSTPEILSIDYNKGIIELKCKTHKTKKVNIRDYFEKESKYLYNNILDAMMIKPEYKKIIYLIFLIIL